MHDSRQSPERYYRRSLALNLVLGALVSVPVLVGLMLAAIFILPGCSSSDISAPEDVPEITSMSFRPDLRAVRPGESVQVAVSRSGGRIGRASGVCVNSSGEAVSEHTVWDGARNPFLFECEFDKPGRGYALFSARYISGAVVSDSVAVAVVDTSDAP